MLKKYQGFIYLGILILIIVMKEFIPITKWSSNTATLVAGIGGAFIGGMVALVIAKMSIEKQETNEIKREKDRLKFEILKEVHFLKKLNSTMVLLKGGLFFLTLYLNKINN